MEKAGLTDAAFADTSCFPASFAQVEETRPPDPPAGDQFDLLNPGIVQRKGFLDPDSVGNFPDGVGGVHLTTLALDDDALENLDSLLVSFNDTDVHFDIVSGAELRMVVPHLLFVYFTDDWVHGSDS